MSTPQTIMVELDKLKPHPLQAEIFSDLADAQLEELADDMDARGLRHAIEITSDYVIIAGHQRVRAARKLEWTEIEAIIRTDLEDEGRAAIEEHLIADNLHRRQLSKLDIARCVKRLADMYDAEEPPANCNESIDRHVLMRDRVGAIVGYSGRHIDRLLAILQAPAVVQQAYEAGQLTLAEAAKAGSLHAGHQAEILAKIESGMTVREALAPFLRRLKHYKSPAATYNKLLTALERATDELAPAVEFVPIRPSEVEAHITTLRRAMELLDRLLSRETGQTASGSAQEAV